LECSYLISNLKETGRQHTRMTRTHFIHIYLHRKKGSHKWTSNSKPCNHVSDALPLH